MRVRVLESRVYGGRKLLKAGQVVEVDDGDGAQWISQGFMEAAPEMKKTMLADPVDAAKPTRRRPAPTDV